MVSRTVVPQQSYLRHNLLFSLIHPRGDQHWLRYVVRLQVTEPQTELYRINIMINEPYYYCHIDGRKTIIIYNIINIRILCDEFRRRIRQIVFPKQIVPLSYPSDIILL